MPQHHIKFQPDSWKTCDKIKLLGFSFHWSCDSLPQNEGYNHWKWYTIVEVNSAYKHFRYEIMFEDSAHNVQRPAGQTRLHGSVCYSFGSNIKDITYLLSKRVKAWKYHGLRQTRSDAKLFCYSGRDCSFRVLNLVQTLSWKKCTNNVHCIKLKKGRNKFRGW